MSRSSRLFDADVVLLITVLSVIAFGGVYFSRTPTSEGNQFEIQTPPELEHVKTGVPMPPLDGTSKVSLYSPANPLTGTPAMTTYFRPDGSAYARRLDTGEVLPVPAELAVPRPEPVTPPMAVARPGPFAGTPAENRYFRTAARAYAQPHDVVEEAPSVPMPLLPGPEVTRGR